MICHDLQRQLEAFLDGTLAPPQQDALRRHLRRCPRCRAEVDAIRRFEDELASAFADAQPAERLWDGMRPELATPDPSRVDTPGPRPFGHTLASPLAGGGRGAHSFPRSGPRRSRTPAQHRRRWPALGAALVLVALIGGSYVGVRERAAAVQLSPVMGAPMMEFGVFRDSGRSLDLAGDDPWKLQAWLAARVGFDLPEPPRPDGFALLGGRLSYLLGRRAAAYAYDFDGQEVALYVMTSAGLDLPRPVPLGDLDAAIGEEGGLTHLLTVEDGLAISVVGALPPTALVPLAAGAARLMPVP